MLLALHDDRFAPVILRFGAVYGLSPRPRFDLVINLLAAKAACEKSITITSTGPWYYVPRAKCSVQASAATSGGPSSTWTTPLRPS